MVAIERLARARPFSGARGLRERASTRVENRSGPHENTQREVLGKARETGRLELRPSAMLASSLSSSRAREAYPDLQEAMSMHCTQCGAFVATGWSVCETCQATARRSQEALMPAPGHVAQAAPPTMDNAALRERLFTFMLDGLTSEGLSDWLRQLHVDARGTVNEKRRRIREHSKFHQERPLAMLAEAMRELSVSSSDALAKLCGEFGISNEASKSRLLRRLHRFIATNEGLLPYRVSRGPSPSVHEVYPFVAWFPVYQSKTYERQYYAEFLDTMTDVFGEELVHEQAPVSHGATLKIDFHIGSAVPGQGGVGIEFKMPTSNSDVQKAIGQIGQYQSRYGASLIVVVFPDFLEQKHLQPFLHELRQRSASHVVKRVFWEEADGGNAS